jgi:hypothetical protein
MKDDKIAIVQDEAERVRVIFRRYLELGGVNALVRDLRERNIRTKTRPLATGVTRGGIPFERGSLFYLLRNREPVSDNRVRNGIFRCRDGRVKTASSLGRDRYGDEGRLEKPAFRGANSRMSGGVRYLHTGWWWS